MKIECTRGFGLVEHPNTSEEINVEEPFETDRETYEALTDAYPGFRVVEDGDSGRDSGGEDGGNTDLEWSDATHWRTVVSNVEDGKYDGRLDELADLDDRSSVQEAIAERRDALSDE
jgi:hypothetical protein